MIRLALPVGRAGCAALVLLLAGCSGSGGDKTDGPSPHASADAGSSSAPSSAGASATSGETPSSADTRTITDARAGVSFEIGTDWHQLEPLLIQTAAADAELAASVGSNLALTRDQIEQLGASNLVVLATSDAGGSLTAVVSDEPLRASSRVASYYEDLGATNVRASALHTAAGDGVRVDFTVDVDNAVRYGRAAWVAVKGHEVAIAFSGAEESAIDAEFGRVVGSLRPADTTTSFTVPEVDVAFELPVGWEDVDLAKLKETLADAEATEALVARTGFTREQLESLANSGVPLFIVGPRNAQGYPPNLSCGVIGEVMPTARAAMRQLRPYGVGDFHTSKVASSVGDGFALTYNAADGQLFNDRLWIDVHGQIIMISVSETDAHRLSELVTGILDSLAPAT